jgi:hypothetical protein
LNIRNRWIRGGALGLVATLGGCYAGRSDRDPSAADGTDGADGGDASDGDDAGDGDGVPMGECLEDLPPQHLVRRLTATEYVNTIQDTLGVDISAEAAAHLPAELRSEGFSNSAAALLVTFDHVEAYHDLATVIVQRIPDLPGLISAHTSCTDFAEACETELTANLGLELWRRPLTDEELASFGGIFDTVQEEGETFTDAGGLLVQALLQTPPFLYRLEDEYPTGGSLGEIRALDDWEIATRLSYLVLGSSPDQALLAAASAEQLHTPEQIEAQVRRLLELPRARETSLRYVEDWLALSGLLNLNRDPAIYPGFTTELGAAMREETLALADELLWEQRAPIESLLTADFTYASPELAAFYGFTDPGPGLQRYDLSDAEHRLGLLTQAGVLAINGHGNRPSIVERGLFVLGGMMCGSVVAPPANVDTSMADLEPDQSARYYSQARLDNATCASCHSQFDSLGYAFEPFDGVGQWQETDEFGNALQQDGWYFEKPGGDPIPYADAREFAQLLATSERVYECVAVRKPLQFAVGRPLESEDACRTEGVALALAETDGSYQELMVAIATHDAFRHIRAGAGQ